MDYTKLAKQHLQDAITLGYITLGSGETLPLKASEILAISRYIIKEGLADTVDVAVTKPSMPSDMFTMHNSASEMANLSPLYTEPNAFNGLPLEQK